MIYGIGPYAVGEAYAGSTIAAVKELSVTGFYSSSVFSSIASDATSVVIEESFKDVKPINTVIGLTG